MLKQQLIKVVVFAILLKDGVKLDININDNLLDISIVNKGSTSIILNSLKLDLFSTKDYSEGFCIVNPKSSGEKITSVPLSKIKQDKKMASQLFEIFVDEENHSSRIFAFLGSTFSNNYILNVIEKNEFKINAVYNFIKQELELGEEFILDSIYIKKGHNIFSLLNGYFDSMMSSYRLNNEDIKLTDHEKHIGDSLLFTSKISSNTLKINNRSVNVNVDGKKLYAVHVLC